MDLAYPWLPEQDAKPASCCLCGGRSPAETVFRFTLNGRTFRILRCVADDLMFLDPQPGVAYAAALYNHPSYYVGEEDMYGVSSDPQKGRETARLRIGEILAGGNSSKGSFLEIGCGMGYTLEAAEAAGMTARGIEFSMSAVADCRARGLAVELVSLETPIPPSISAAAPYDVVALYSVFEHLPDPALLIGKLPALLAPAGSLVVRVPRMAADGPWLSLLDHLWHFTEASLRRLLEQGGFRVTDLFPSGRFIGRQHGGVLESMTAVARLAQGS